MPLCAHDSVYEGSPEGLSCAHPPKVPLLATEAISHRAVLCPEARPWVKQAHREMFPGNEE